MVVRFHGVHWQRLVKGLRSIESLNVKEKEDLVQQVLDKKNGGCDIDWRDIVEDFQLDCSPETLRKAGVGVKLAEDAGMCFPADIAGTRDVMDGYVERQKLYDLRREVRKDLREQSRSEMLRELIRDAIAQLPEIQINPNKRWQNEGRESDLVIGIGDFHYGADFTVTGLYGEILNEYNTDLFVRRMETLISEIVDIVVLHKPKQLTVMIVGDMLDGLLRTSQLQRLEPLGTKAGQFPEENMERVVMHYLHERFSFNPYVLVEDNDAPMNRIIDVCGFKFLLVHGQGGNIEQIARDHQNLYHNQIDVFMVGHLHKSQTFNAGICPGGNVLIERVPSICGIDPYAQSKGYGAPPGATVILMEEGYGRRCVYPIILT